MSDYGDDKQFWIMLGIFIVVILTLICVINFEEQLYNLYISLWGDAVLNQVRIE